jgi:hypothetical protein
MDFRDAAPPLLRRRTVAGMQALAFNALPGEEQSYRRSGPYLNELADPDAPEDGSVSGAIAQGRCRPCGVDPSRRRLWASGSAGR